MHLRVNLKFLGAILVHPVRRQNFAGTGAPQILQHLRLCRIVRDKGTLILIDRLLMPTQAQTFTSLIFIKN